LFSFVADHFQYLASLGIIALLVCSFATWLASSRRLIAVGTPALVVLFVLTWRQASTYENAETVWRDTLSKNNNAWMPHNNLASSLISRAGGYQAQGKLSEARALAAEALAHVQQALELKPDHRTALTNIAEALRILGRYEEAIPFAQRALQIIIDNEVRYLGKSPDRSPKQAEAQWQLGRLYELNSQFEDALVHYRGSVELNPNDRGVHEVLGLLLMRMNRLIEATPQFEAVLQSDPENVNALGFLGEMKERERQFVEASSLYRRGLASVKSKAEFIHIGYKLLRLMVTADDPSLREPAKAVQLGEQLRQADPGNPFVLGMLARAYADSGQFDDAIATAAQARTIAQQAKLDELVKEIDATLERIRGTRTGLP
jgi:protein O-mannosyl-transferase